MDTGKTLPFTTVIAVANSVQSVTNNIKKYLFLITSRNFGDFATSAQFFFFVDGLLFVRFVALAILPLFTSTCSGGSKDPKI